MKILSSQRSRFLSVPVLAVCAALMLPPVGSAMAADPPGNNGTIKIDGRPFDTHPDNQPHVGCAFQLDFYGYDQGNFYADVRFTVHPPTGQAVVLRTDRVFVGEDAAGGGTDLDAARTYNLSSALRSFTPHPKQGYHIKVEVTAPHSIGADTKYKVFWVESCGYPS